MNERNMIEKLNDRDKKRDALFGVLHIKDKPYLHQRTAQHMFGETESAVIVPVSTLTHVWDGHTGKAERVFNIGLVALAGAGIVAFLVYLFHLNPGYLIPFF